MIQEEREAAEAVGSAAAAGAAQPSAPSEARRAGRGFLVITGAKLYFMVTGALTQLSLPVLFGSAETFGAFKIVTEAVGILNMVIVTSTLQTVAKATSERPDQARRLVGRALRLQCAIGLPLALAYALGALPIARDFFHDASLAAPMRWSAGVIAAYAFYAVFVGYLNGAKAFVRQARLDIGFQTLKTAGILGLVALGLGVTGAVWGFVGAAATIALASGVVVWRTLGASPKAAPEAAPAGEGARLGIFLALVMLYTFALNFLLRIDLLLIKSIASEPSAALLGWEGVFGTVSDKFAGFYGAALNLARLPYQGVIAVTFVVFPMISGATFADDKTRARSYIEETMRYCLLLLGAIAIPLILHADSLIASLYSADYRAASVALATMSAGMIAFALFFVAVTVITSAGRPGVAAWLMWGTFGASALANWWAIGQVHETTIAALSAPRLDALPVGEGASVLVAAAAERARASSELAAAYVRAAPAYMSAAAAATASSMALGLIGALVWLRRTWGARAPWASAARLGLGGALLLVVDLALPDPARLGAWLGWEGARAKLASLGAVALSMGAMMIVLLLVLWAAREFGPEDRARLRAVLRRGPKKARSSLLLVLFTLGAACASAPEVEEEPSAEERVALGATVSAFHKEFRWARYQYAAQFASEGFRERFLGRYDELGDDFHLVSLEIKEVSMPERGGPDAIARIEVEERSYTEPRMVVRKRRVIESWERQGDRWVLVDRALKEARGPDARSESSARPSSY